MMKIATSQAVLIEDGGPVNTTELYRLMVNTDQLVLTYLLGTHFVIEHISGRAELSDLIGRSDYWLPIVRTTNHA